MGIKSVLKKLFLGIEDEDEEEQRKETSIIINRKVERREEKPSEIPGLKSNSIIFGVISGKGGVGKSLFLVNTAIVLSVIYGGVLVVDTDIVNMTSTTYLLFKNTDILTKGSEAGSFFDYLYDPSKGFGLLKIEDKSFGIPLATDNRLAVGIRDLYLIPAKYLSPTEDTKLRYINRYDRKEIEQILFSFYKKVLEIAQSKKIKYILFDFQPLEPIKRAAVRNIHYLLSIIDNFIVILPPDIPSIYGTASTLSGSYGHVKRKLKGAVVNFIQPTIDRDHLKKIIYYTKNTLTDNICFIRADKRWRRSSKLVPPIIIGRPDKGANYDLLRCLVKMKLTRREDIKKILGVEITA